ncbi:metal ABC transporter solute-binding protein, Zn/Mn family [Bombilactobacillus thymidiniphilus]|uniref:Zinc ABC transporter substrate-binding protein n=1 Tax=Bombilactobacillus thymidiniphilus TaxID=2923363 RepID=A0ABY4PC13_9LACO|nr:zinc ABC transporter substrate-binding protein [Bombilactobacillus thymidiniphilus]UQS83130.1 zinc ABC transporter substrate-binding protein [Bombilactobacillus thymidiniphilus]
MFKKRLFWLVPVLLLLVGCQTTKSQQSSKATTKIQVVTSTPTYAQMARKIGGGQVAVTSLISNPNADPHDFEPSVQDAKKASQAAVAIYNGLGYDSWMNKLLVNNEQVHKINIGQLMNKKTGDNPHIWYEPKALPAAANQLARELSAQRPAKKNYFEKNAQKYIADLKPINEQLQTIKQKRQLKQVAVSEPVFDYSLAAMGYEIVDADFAKAVESGSDPAPKDVEALQELIKKREIAFFVVNKQTTNPVVGNLTKLAQQHQVPIVKVSETQPAGQTYQQWMQKQYQQVLKIEAH